MSYTTAENTTNITVDWREAAWPAANYCAPEDHDFSCELPYHDGPERVCGKCGYCNWWDWD